VYVDRNASTYGYLLGAAGHILRTFDRINLDDEIAGITVVNEMFALGCAQHVSLRFGVSFHFRS
jgi:hypothetical protein